MTPGMVYVLLDHAVQCLVMAESHAAHGDALTAASRHAKAMRLLDEVRTTQITVQGVGGPVALGGPTSSPTTDPEVSP